MRIRIICLLLISLLLFSCFQRGPQNGTLNFRTAINEDLAKSTGTTSDTCLVEDLIWRFASFEVSTGRILAGAPDTLEWVSVYSDTTESRLSEFEFEAELEPGTYRSIRLAMRNRNWWVVDWEDSLIEVEDWNRSSAMYGPEETSYSYYDYRGCWYCDDGAFENVAPDESAADILIWNGNTVYVVMNWNMHKLVLNMEDYPDSVQIRDWLIREGYDMIEWDVTYPPDFSHN